MFFKEGSSGLDVLGTIQSLSKNTSYGPSVGTPSTLSLYCRPSTISAAVLKTQIRCKRVKGFNYCLSLKSNTKFGALLTNSKMSHTCVTFWSSSTSIISIHKISGHNSFASGLQSIQATKMKTLTH